MSCVFTLQVLSEIFTLINYSWQRSIRVNKQLLQVIKLQNEAQAFDSLHASLALTTLQHPDHLFVLNDNTWEALVCFKEKSINQSINKRWGEKSFLPGPFAYSLGFQKLVVQGVLKKCSGSDGLENTS